MSQYLLPVKTGDEQFPVRYKSIFYGSWEPYNSLLTEHNKALYMYSQQYYNQYNPSQGPGNAQLYKMNLLTSSVTKVCNFTYTQLSSCTIGGILADDNYLYASASSGNLKIVIFKLKKAAGASETDPLPIDDTYTNTSLVYRCAGKILWFNKTIVMCIATGYLMYNTETHTASQKAYNGSNFSFNDFAVGQRYFVSTMQYSGQLYIYDSTLNSWSTATLPTSNTPCIAYEDEKFYIANSGKLYVYSESGMELLNTYNGNWGEPKTVSVTRGKVYVTVKNSNRLYVYDTTIPKQTSFYLPWNIQGDMSQYPLYPLAWEGFYFLLQFTLCIVDNTGESKYNFGPKYENILLMMNKDTQSQYTFDPRFITFEDTFMTMHDGDITDKPIMPVDLENHIKKISVSKSEYKFLNYIVFKTNEGSDENE